MSPDPTACPKSPDGVHKRVVDTILGDECLWCMAALAPKLPDLPVRVDARMPPGVMLVGAREQIDRILELWDADPTLPPHPPVEIRDGEVAVLRLSREPDADDR